MTCMNACHAFKNRNISTCVFFFFDKLPNGNRVEPENDFEQTFSAYREFDATMMLQEIQQSLSDEIVDELVDQIYNATVANW